MAAFDVLVDGKTYKMFFNRDSARRFEEIGGNTSDLKEKPYSTTSKLFYAGLLKYHPTISPAEAFEIADKALEEYGLDTVYSELLNRYLEVFTSAGSSSSKSFVVKNS